MPIVTVELVVNAERPPDRNLAQALADAVGRALESPPGQTWVRLRSLSLSEYAENESPVDSGELPVFVSILERQPPTGAKLQTEISVLTRAVAHVLGRPATCVHIDYAPAAAGRISFGGKLVP